MTIEKVQALISAYRDDAEMLENIYSALETFEAYHAAIYTMETNSKLYTAEVIGSDEYRKRYSEMDKARTSKHNALIAEVSMLNRMCELAGIPPVYEGEVSKEKGIRRQVANAVLSLVEEIIKNRV